MILQNIVLPKNGNSGKIQLYAASEKPIFDFPMELNQGESISFAAYFNYFSLSKWLKYTTIESLEVFVNCTGKLRLSIAHHSIVDGEETSFELCSYDICGDSNSELQDFPYHGLLSISITSLSDHSKIFGAGFSSISATQRNVRIGIDMCTYKREQNVTEKINSLLPLLTDVSSHISNSVELFVIDNGNTIDKEHAVSNKIHIIQNRNLGGSGGFSKGMMEIMGSGKFTHILLNDDDASFDPETIYRTWTMLSLLKEEYKDALIGGAMLLSDMPNIVHESGAFYTERDLYPSKRKLNLAIAKDCLRFDIEERMNYFGWWYLALPCSYVKEMGYPLPLFIKEDDIEYGIRKKGPVMITLNGISIWHDSFVSKFSTSNYYYYARNHLTIGCTTANLERSDVTWMLKNALLEAVCYRYECSEMMFRGISDSLKGPEFVFGQCLHGVVDSVPVNIGKLEELRKGIEFEDTDEINKESFSKRSLTMNGLLLRSKRNIETSTDNMDSSDFYRVGKVLYNINGKDGFIAERSMKRTVLAILRTVKLWFKTLFLFRRLKKRYKKSLKVYSSEEHWKKIFEM